MAGRRAVGSGMALLAGLLTSFSGLAADFSGHARVSGLRGKAAPPVGVRGVRRPPPFPKIAPAPRLDMSAPRSSPGAPDAVTSGGASARLSGHDSDMKDEDGTPLHSTMDVRFPTMSPADGQEERDVDPPRH